MFFCALLLNLFSNHSTGVAPHQPAEVIASAPAAASSNSVEPTNRYQTRSQRDFEQHHKVIAYRVEKIREALNDTSLHSDFNREIRKLALPIFLPQFYPELRFIMRAKALSWLGEVADALGLSYHSYFLAVHIFDRYLCKRTTLNNPILSKDLQAIAIASLQIAGSINDERSEFLLRIDKPQTAAEPEFTHVRALSNESCAYQTGYTYSPFVIFKTAYDIMTTLDYELALNPTVDFWVYYYLKRLGFSPENDPVSFSLIFKNAMQILSLAVLDADSRAFAPCELAFATIQLMFPNAPILAPIDSECLSFMQYYSGIMLQMPIPPKRGSVSKSTLCSVAADFTGAQDWTWFRHVPFYRTYAESYEEDSFLRRAPYTKSL